MVLTLGVEEEFLIADVTTGGLVPQSHRLVPRYYKKRGMPEGFTRELNLCQIEVATPVCTSSEQLRSHLRASRRDLQLAAESVGLTPLPVGSHPFSSWRNQQVDRSDPRYGRMEDDFQQVAREQVICGCHVHVGIPDPDLRIAVMTRARPWLPVLVAMTANSPFWEGLDTGYDSYRIEVWRKWPTSGMPPALSSMADYVDILSRLKLVGAAADASYIYWHIRPSSRFETLEFRATDTCLTVDDTVMLGILVRALVSTCVDEIASDAPAAPWRRDTLEAAMWRAARFGLSGELADPLTSELRPAREVVQMLVAHVGKALQRDGEHAGLVAGVDRLLATGNGATRQRRAMESGSSVVDAIGAMAFGPSELNGLRRPDMAGHP
ncbi:MAG: glutamate--cysteine ligase [Actinomycetota bacterium]|nr:glutamate--cysteine ligase [Actinomycetota bacterium]